MKAQFNQQEKLILRGQASKLALKHSCSSVYVNLIIKGTRNINTPKAKAIHQDLKRILTLLKPQKGNN